MAGEDQGPWPRLFVVARSVAKGAVSLRFTLVRAVAFQAHRAPQQHSVSRRLGPLSARGASNPTLDPLNSTL